MTDSNHPITPPPELVQAFLRSNPHTPPEMTYEQVIATRFARWGADQELDACCEWLELHYPHVYTTRLKRCRRPEPPSLKERGREALQSIHNAVVMETGGRELDVLKEIVESLPD